MDNELAVLFGYSGSGKSMTMRMLAGLVRPDSGRIVRDGEVLYDSETKRSVPPQERQFGFVGQDLALFPHMTVAKNIAYGLKGLSKEESHARVAEFIRLLHLKGLGVRLPREISGGQRQRVALARALASRPKALLLDEPFSALDSPLKAELWEAIREVREQVRIPILVVTHDPTDARTEADRIIVYGAGRVLRCGTPDEVLCDPDCPEIATLIADDHPATKTGSGSTNGLHVLMSSLDGSSPYALGESSDADLEWRPRSAGRGLGSWPGRLRRAYSIWSKL
ncbi:MAG: ABC transporter ATP-binding protein [Thermoleophilia bacterium]|nr:ABC transporter ATP-binding protein [Thermoleophilia bacterium]